MMKLKSLPQNIFEVAKSNEQKGVNMKVLHAKL